MRETRAGGRPTTPEAQNALRALGGRSFNLPAGAVPDRSGDGWQVDHYRQTLPAEAPGDPAPGGSWESARRLVGDYRFADPRIIRAVFEPDRPLEGRDMLLEGRFLGLRFHLGVRVAEVTDDRREVAGRPVRVWGWEYGTLEGHLEAGRMDWAVWKWLDTGEVEFRVRRAVRTAEIPNPVIRLGWALFGRGMQVWFVRRSCTRLEALVAAELERATTDVEYPTAERDAYPTAERDAAVPNPAPAAGSPPAVFRFRFAPLYRVVGAPFGVRPARAWIVVASERLQIRFGPWYVDTPTANIAGWERTGPFGRLKTLGPAHLSLADRGLTCATNPDEGLCIRFREPVGGMDPQHRLRHPGVTVTVADIDGLEAALRAVQAGGVASPERPGSAPS